MKVCYTVIIGGYDQLRQPTVITPGWKYICITDTPEICEDTVYEAKAPYEVKPKTGKEEKWVFPSEVSESNGIAVYHDGSFKITGNLDEFIAPFEDKPFATRLHPSRKNALQELQACLDAKKITPEEAAWAILQYDETELPETHPLLWENGILYFSTNAPLYADWEGHFWHLSNLLGYLTLDQILLPMVLDGAELPALIDRERAKEYFKWFPHNK